MPKMKLLNKKGYFNRGLIEVASPVLIRRYNECLIDMGIETTKLKRFQIDRTGWSPEIAEEKGDDYYLSHGPANQLLIVIIPEQRYAPIYFPFHSYDWDLIEAWFKKFWTQIKELTKETGIWVDIDQEVEAYEVPSDLLMVDTIIVRASTPCGLMTRAEDQQRLVKTFLSEPDAHMDIELLKQLEESAKDNGDLRGRKLSVKELPTSAALSDDFYSRVFGGIFVIRSKCETRIFARDMEIAAGDNVFPADESAIDYLVEHGYIATDVEWWRKHAYRLEIVAESFLIDVLEVREPRLDYAKLNRAKIKQLINRYEDELGMYLEFKRVIDKLKKKQKLKISRKVLLHLYHPDDSLDASSRDVVWQLLTYIKGGRLMPLFYRYQKTAFLEAFTKKWKTPKRTWALAKVREFYDLASKSSGVLP